ncbi:MAG: BrxE family protein [Proteobacteria bacterium]|nr:BrxE family protein [Pseudomonadota bacterium]
MTFDSDKLTKIIDQTVLLRLTVGYLGQRKQSGRWDCDFLDATGIRFLEATFPRTAWAAALRSTTEAACTVHDQALGRVGNSHLFRLPPALEEQDLLKI